MTPSTRVRQFNHAVSALVQAALRVGLHLPDRQQILPVALIQCAGEKKGKPGFSSDSSVSLRAVGSQQGAPAHGHESRGFNG